MHAIGIQFPYAQVSNVPVDVTMAVCPAVAELHAGKSDTPSAWSWTA
jgi:hypothetical protein